MPRAQQTAKVQYIYHLLTSRQQIPCHSSPISQRHPRDQSKTNIAHQLQINQTLLPFTGIIDERKTSITNRNLT
jgi:hypothetical protein